MKVLRTLSHWPLVLAILVALVARTHATGWYDDFSDGDAEDGNPAMWFPLSDFFPGVYDASSGDYVLTPTNDADDGEIMASIVPDVVFGDTYVQTRTLVETTVPGNGGNVGLVARFNPDIFFAYSGVIDSAGGLFLTRFEAVATVELAEYHDLEFGADTDVMFEMSVVGDVINLTAWELGQPKPEPQISYPDTGTSLSNGVAGVVYIEDNNDTAGVFRWVEASDVPLIYTDFNRDGKVNVDDYDILAPNFLTAGGASHGDANRDGFIDLEDLVMWRADTENPDIPHSAAGSAVPEPSALLLGVLFAGMLAATRTARRRFGTVA